MRVFICLPLNDVQLSRLQEAVGSTVLHVHPDFDQGGHCRSIFDTCEIVFGNPPVRWITENAALRWVQLDSVGFGEYTGLNWDQLGQRLQITNLAGFFAEPVAESILAGILASYRGIDRLIALRRRREWQGDVLRTALKTLVGANVVLFRFGAVNRRLAQILSPFGCRVQPFRREWNGFELDLTLKGADIVVCTAPDTP
jgi:glyoxylate/hydroxypyruvate reductase